MSEEPTKAVSPLRQRMIDDMRMRKLCGQDADCHFNRRAWLGPTSCMTSRKSRPLVAQQSD